MSVVRVLLLDDDPASSLEVFEKLLAVRITPQLTREFESGESISLSAALAGITVELRLQCVPEDLVEELLNELVGVLAGETWDLILVDDHWGTEGDTAGQRRILPFVIEHAQHEPLVALFTQHWEEPDRAAGFGSRLMALSDFSGDPSAVHRITGLHKEDKAGFAYILHRVLAEETLRKQIREKEAIRQVAAMPPGSKQARGKMIGDSPAMQEVYRLIAKAAMSDLPVLVTGESGTGKELVAHAIHSESARASGPFYATAIAAESVNLVESKLFGHVKGAYTGATTNRDGAFKKTEKGTLFIDEVGELPPDTQVKFLRALDPGEYERVGDSDVKTTESRLIAATNADLVRMVEDGRFREDLFYRLNCIEVHLPPLRDRDNDIELLARHFSSGCEISDHAFNVLKSHDWPGNVRELRKTVERANAIRDGERIEEHDIKLTALRRRQPRSRHSRFKNGELVKVENSLNELEVAAKAIEDRGKRVSIAAIERELKLSRNAINDRVKGAIAEAYRVQLTDNPSRWPLIRKLPTIARLT